MTCAHQVQFYAADDPLGANVSSFLAVPLLRDEAAVVVATEQHRKQFAAALTSAGVDVAAARAEGRYLELDAARTLATFMTPDGPDERRFRAVVGGVVTDAVERFGAVSAYGEMVGLLAADGQIVAALQLEAHWSRLMNELPFRLLCGYPREAFDEATAQLALYGVCAAHDAVAPTRTLSAAVDLPLGPRAGALAREASRDICLAWCLSDPGWLDDVLLVVSELVGNAVRHGSSKVTLSLDAYGRRISLSVTDGSLTLPAPRVGAKLAEDGRGFTIIDALADRWGVEKQPRGKRVWVELPPCPPHAGTSRHAPTGGPREPSD